MTNPSSKQVEPELKGDAPCPWCAQLPEIKSKTNLGIRYLGCPTRGCIGRDLHFVIDHLWNTRIPVDSVAPRVDCQWCKSGNVPKFLDDDGTNCAISHEPGTLCHAHEEYWWPCLRFGRELTWPAAASPAPKEEEASIPPIGYERAITIEWDKHNERRHELIETARSSLLSESELVELHELQWLAGIKRELQNGPLPLLLWYQSAIPTTDTIS